LECDEAQDISSEKHDKEFAPMVATTNAVRIYYGTAWDENTLLERVKQAHQDSERRDGVRRHFEYPWWVVAEFNPAYGAYVEGERARLGESHPLFRTQYKLETIGGTAGFLAAQQRGQMQGEHRRAHRREDGATYVAGVDIAGAGEESAGVGLRTLCDRHDSTVVTVARVSWEDIDQLAGEPRLEVVQHYWWTGQGHRQQYVALRDLLGSVWECNRVVVDATGIGAAPAEFLRAALGESIVRPLVFTAASKSRLGYRLLAAVNGGRFKVYAADGSPEGEEFWRQCERARYSVRANQTLNFYVPEAEGHDDFVMSAALCVEATRGLGGPGAAGTLARRKTEWEDGRY
jgi:hypothetical protein